MSAYNVPHIMKPSHNISADIYIYLTSNLKKMHHLKRFLFGIILLPSPGSAFADECVPKQDDFDQLINALVPILIIFCLNQKERNFRKRKGY